MSEWMHVSAIFRLDSFGRIEDEEIIKISGKQVDFWHMNEIEYDENYEVKDKEQYLPMGSEGTLKMSIWHNPDKSSLASTTVSVFGDLRDFWDFDEIESWFNRCCNSFGKTTGVRQAVCQATSSIGTKIFQL